MGFSISKFLVNSFVEKNCQKSRTEREIERYLDLKLTRKKNYDIKNLKKYFLMWN